MLESGQIGTHKVLVPLNNFRTTVIFLEALRKFYSSTISTHKPDVLKSLKSWTAYCFMQ